MGWKTFNVVGVNFKDHEGETMRRIDKIARYSKQGSAFAMQRDPSNEYDFNAIEVRQYFKSGASIRIGYVPRQLAKKLAPAMDKGWEPEVQFGRKFIDKATCECMGLQLRYEEF
jgi:hypothetical protein